MAFFLLLDTSSPICSVALASDSNLLASRQSDPEANHSALINSLITDCLREADLDLKDLDALAISAGPGSYTGLRVGFSTAKGLCYGLDLPLICIPSLDALAASSRKQYPGDELLHLAMIDARRMEVSAALYDAAGHQLESFPELILEKGCLPRYEAQADKLILSGSGASKWAAAGLAAALDSGIRSSAANLPDILMPYWENKRFTQLTSAAPIYFKKPNITTPGKQLLG